MKNSNTEMTLEQHAAEYDALAASQEAEGTDASRNRANTSRRAAKSLRLEAETGTPHCVCCLRPLSCGTQGGANWTKPHG